MKELQAVSINRVDRLLPGWWGMQAHPSTFLLNQELDGGDDDALWEPQVGNEGLTYA